MSKVRSGGEAVRTAGDARRAGRRAAVGGGILPCRVGWGPCYVYGLADEADFRLMWERAIR
ncbi:hypothetical protein GTZ89_21915 [Streptomyces sp. SID8382]|uniref:hypothetical protein n=1 Tax=Streptomyces malaysiensis TaxID=92644 RepID=UPI001369A2A1|nr:hypothetical protein [Streptomyces sp. SID8382]MYX58244.1 hypothetical protein [Streptomyces sp. SID8382]